MTKVVNQNGNRIQFYLGKMKVKDQSLICDILFKASPDIKLNNNSIHFWSPSMHLKRAEIILARLNQKEN